MKALQTMLLNEVDSLKHLFEETRQRVQNKSAALSNPDSLLDIFEDNYTTYMNELKSIVSASYDAQYITALIRYYSTMYHQVSKAIADKTEEEFIASFMSSISNETFLVPSTPSTVMVDDEQARAQKAGKLKVFKEITALLTLKTFP